MFLLVVMGVALLWYGRRVTASSLYPNGRPDGRRWPIRQIVASIPRWEQERVLMVIGGITLQAAGMIIVLGSLL